MKKLLVVGAGKSSTALIHYLSGKASKYKWEVTIADCDEKLLTGKTHHLPGIHIAVMDITCSRQRREQIRKSDLVLSLMPPHLHILLAKDCLQYKKNLITSSYISEEMREMDAAVRAAGLMFMGEMGLDPGLDHMVASQIMHSIRRVAGDIISYKSYCGGLIAPEYGNPPWRHKISWNPRNIVRAGMGGAQYLEHGKLVEIPYESLFAKAHRIRIEGVGTLAYYPNRDSLHYINLYDIPETSTILRATLRYPNFCKGWDSVVRLGLTLPDDRFDTTNMTVRSWIRQKTGFAGAADSLPAFIARKLHVQPDSLTIRMLAALGLWEDTPLKPGIHSSADILEDLLVDKWHMEPWEQDMVVMQHEVAYTGKTKHANLTSTMVLKGENRELSAMAKTVGLPMGILAKLMMTERISPIPGVHIPVAPEIYKPVLKTLERHGIRFIDRVT